MQNQIASLSFFCNIVICTSENEVQMKLRKLIKGVWGVNYNVIKIKNYAFILGSL